jgi:hypothetical protein
MTSILDIGLLFYLSNADTGFFVASSISGKIFLFQLLERTVEMAGKKAKVKAKMMQFEVDSWDAVGFS